jgi:hypothetical protein
VPAWIAAIPPLLAVAVNRRALGVGFTPDDLQLLELARGITVSPPTLWRVLSRRLYLVATLPVFGTEPTGYHVLSLLLHALVTALLYAWARSLGGSRLAAFLAAAMFGVSALHRTVVWQATTAGESMAAALTLTAGLLVVRDSWPNRAMAIAAHGLALLSKENVALAPLAALAGATAEQRRRVLGTVAAMVGLSAALWTYLLATRSHLGGIAGEAYAFGIGPHVLTNIVTYASWCADLLRLAPNAAPSWAGGLWAGLVFFGLLASALRGGPRAVRAGLALWLAVLLPVLPLAHQVYEHYAYLAFAGFSLAAATAVVDVVERARGLATAAGRLAWAFAMLVVLALVGVTEHEYGGLLERRIPSLGLPLDPMLRKMEVAMNAQRDLAAGLEPAPARLLIVSPPGESSVYSVRTGRMVERAAAGAPSYNVLAAVLDDGRALRALFPQLSQVRLDEHLVASDTGAVLAANRVDGHLRLFGRGPGAHLALANYWASVGLAEPARIHLAEAAALYPDAPELAPYRAGSPGAGLPAH